VRGVTETTAYLAKLPNLPDSTDGLETIQLFPPGEHEVVVTNGKGEAVPLTVAITPETAEVLEAARARYQAEADAGTGDAPYLDFNHDDREASAWVKAIAWAGDDPLTGGVRATVELSEAGRAAIAGKTFRRVSPSFHAEDGRITGAPANMGGFVNRAAFRTIAPLFAKASDPSPENENPTTMMTPEEITALQQENAALKKQLEDLTAELHGMKKTEAEALVAKAASEGRIAPAKDVQEKWVASLLTNPASKDLLMAMAPNPALAPSVLSAHQKAAAAAEEDAAALLAKFHELPREEQPAFFAKHREALRSTTFNR
jgi:hypothetical protein